MSELVGRDKVQFVPQVVTRGALSSRPADTRNDIVRRIREEVVISQQEVQILGGRKIKEHVRGLDIRTLHRIDKPKVLVTERKQVVKPVKVSPWEIPGRVIVVAPKCRLLISTQLAAQTRGKKSGSVVEP